MYDRVLVAVDGSDPAAGAAERAVDLAATYGADLHALFVVETDTGWLTVSKSEVREALREVGEDEAERALATVESLADDAEVELVTATLEGSPDEAILEYAAAEGVDIVVVGTHGRSGIERRLVGSVAERVVRGATVPVLTVGRRETPE